MLKQSSIRITKVLASLLVVFLVVSVTATAMSTKPAVVEEKKIVAIDIDNGQIKAVKGISIANENGEIKAAKGVAINKETGEIKAAKGMAINKEIDNDQDMSGDY